MTKEKPESLLLKLADGAACVAAFAFVLSVVNNTRDLIQFNTKNAPVSYALILALVLVAFTCHQRKRLNTVSLIVLSVLATSVFIWAFGLSVPTGSSSIFMAN